MASLWLILHCNVTHHQQHLMHPFVHPHKSDEKQLKIQLVSTDLYKFNTCTNKCALPPKGLSFILFPNPTLQHACLSRRFAAWGAKSLHPTSPWLQLQRRKLFAASQGVQSSNHLMVLESFVCCNCFVWQRVAVHETRQLRRSNVFILAHSWSLQQPYELWQLWISNMFSLAPSWSL